VISEVLLAEDAGGSIVIHTFGREGGKEGGREGGREGGVGSVREGVGGREIWVSF